jgi:ribosomal protein L37AE/L43A
MADKRGYKWCPVCGKSGHYGNPPHCECASVEGNAIQSEHDIHYCPSCGVHNPQWVRQKNMPLKCRHCKKEFVKLRR